MPKEIVIATPTAFELGPEATPILPNWVLSGTPSSRVKNVVRSRDWTSHVVVWECTRGKFKWHYHQDEVLVIVSGEVFITTEEGQECRLGPGDMAFFPAGSSGTWRVPERVRKVAVIRETIWWPLGLGLKIWKKLLRLAGVAAKHPWDSPI
jgi:uncharacterized cupin superfamily protein